MLVILALCCLCGLTGCWDLVEINQLAIGSMAGGDFDPETKNKLFITILLILQLLLFKKDQELKLRSTPTGSKRMIWHS